MDAISNENDEQGQAVILEQGLHVDGTLILEGRNDARRFLAVEAGARLATMNTVHAIEGYAVCEVELQLGPSSAYEEFPTWFLLLR